MNDVYIVKVLVQNGETSPFFNKRDTHLHSWLLFCSPVVLAKNSPGELGQKGWILERLEEIGWLV